MTESSPSPAAEIQAVLRDRFSPYAFSSEPVADADLRALFESARWAASSYNEQPWRYVVARRADGAAWEGVLACLVEANQAWAKAAPVLALGIVSTRFDRNDKPNAAAEHDLGAASAQLTAEATRRGLVVHQMIGIDPERAARTFSLPDGYRALTALAIGRVAAPEDPIDAGLRERDARPRERRTLAGTVFTGGWAEPAPWLEPG
ncbi:MAG: nitroreductase family protein [bacterium]